MHLYKFKFFAGCNLHRLWYTEKKCIKLTKEGRKIIKHKRNAKWKWMSIEFVSRIGKQPICTSQTKTKRKILNFHNDFFFFDCPNNCTYKQDGGSTERDMKLETLTLHLMKIIETYNFQFVTMIALIFHFVFHKYTKQYQFL